MSAIEFILASSSPRRLSLLEVMGVKPDKVISPDIDETEHKNELPNDLALRLAIEKNKVIVKDHPKSIILTSDTVVACGRFILPKAETKQDFDLCMQKISGRSHRVHTAICVWDGREKQRVRLVSSRVKVKRLTATEIDAFYRTDEWKSKAGGYALQGFFGQFIEQMSGSYSAIVGLPMRETSILLQSSGLRIF